MAKCAIQHVWHGTEVRVPTYILGVRTRRKVSWYEPLEEHCNLLIYKESIVEHLLHNDSLYFPYSSAGAKIYIPILHCI